MPTLRGLFETDVKSTISMVIPPFVEITHVAVELVNAGSCYSRVFISDRETDQQPNRFHASLGSARLALAAIGSNAGYSKKFTWNGSLFTEDKQNIQAHAVGVNESGTDLKANLTVTWRTVKRE